MDVARQLILSLLRHSLSGFAGWLIARGVSTDQVEWLISLIATIVITLGWSLINKLKLYNKIQIALKLPAGSSYEDIKRVEEKEPVPALPLKSGGHTIGGAKDHDHP